MLKISKLTITSIYSGYPDLVSVEKPDSERAARLIKEKLATQVGFYVPKSVPEYEQTYESLTQKIRKQKQKHLLVNA